jgi:hypothetical protein
MSDPQPWHFTTWLDLVDHWQTVIAGLIALIAAIITVRVTLRVERGKADRELDALRRSIAVELRQHIATALSAYDGPRAKIKRRGVDKLKIGDRWQWQPRA